MTTTSLPSLLPFARPTRIGLPYHGLVKDSRLQLDGGGDRYYGNLRSPYTSGFSGDVVPVVAPNNSPVALVTDGDKRWQNYALLSGIDRWIGGAKLGETSWLYCDGRGAWIIDAEWDPTFPSGDPQIGTVNIFLRDTFGRFRVPGEPPHMADRRKLASVDFDFGEVYGGGATLNGLWTLPSETGSRCVLNLPAWPISWNPYAHSPPYWLGVIVASISGEGSLEDGSVGDGISCSLSVAKQLADMSWASGEHPVNPGGVPWPCYFSGVAQMHYYDGDTLSMFVDYAVYGLELSDCGHTGLCAVVDIYEKVGLYRGPAGVGAAVIAADTANSSDGTLHGECDPPQLINGSELSPDLCVVITTGDYVFDPDLWIYGYTGGVNSYYGAEFHRTVYVSWKTVGVELDNSQVTSFYGPSATHTGSDRPLLFSNPWKFEAFSADPVADECTLETKIGEPGYYHVYV